jgi:molybdate transport system substrate-binding protein
MLKKTAIYFLSISMLLCSCAPEKKKDVLFVAAAASLTDAIKEMAAAFEKKDKNCQVKLSLAATGKLRQQIEKGAPVDVFFSADIFFGGAKDYSNIINPKQARPACLNSLVLAVKKDLSLPDKKLDVICEPCIKRLALGSPEYVPAGRYAKELLLEKDLWKKTNDKMIFATNVRQALSWLEAAEVDAAFLYRTDALKSGKVKILDEFVVVNGKKIVYPVGITHKGESNKFSAAFVKFMMSPEGKKILNKYGFVTDDKKLALTK